MEERNPEECNDLERLSNVHDALIKSINILRSRAWQIVSSLEDRPLEDKESKESEPEKPRNKIQQIIRKAEIVEQEITSACVALNRLKPIVGGE